MSDIPVKLIFSVPMITLIYHSTSTYESSPEDLIEFLNFIRLEKLSLNVTGILLYHNREILHIIEGEIEVILALFEKVRVDTRHTSVKKLIHFKIKERAYSDWSMAFKEVSGKDMLNVKGYLNIDDNKTGLPHTTEKSAYLLMLINSFKDQNVMR